MALGFTAMRSRHGGGESASHIVAHALTKLGMRMSERAVERVWSHNKSVVERIAFVPLK